MDSLSAFDYTMITPSLSNPIHPMFEMNQWDTQYTLPAHEPMLPLLHGKDGFGEARRFSKSIIHIVKLTNLKAEIQLFGHCSNLRSDWHLICLMMHLRSRGRNPFCSSSVGRQFHSNVIQVGCSA
jgi:hypothetical protein